MPFLELNNCRFHYKISDYSDPWRPHATVLLHHAAAGNLRRWRARVPVLARRHRVVRFDMRGHGQTPPPSPVRFSLQELAADIARVMDGLDIEKVHLVGASAGGIVALRFAHDFPERLGSLTLVASTPRLAQTRIDREVWRRTLTENGVKAWLLSDAQRRFGPRADPCLVEWYAEEGARTPPEVVLALQECLMAEDLSPLLPQIWVPTLVLAARRDDITPLEMQRLMASQIPDARLNVFSGVGHNMKVEIPDRLARQVLRFIEQVDC